MNYNFNGTITQNGQPVGGGKIYLHIIGFFSGNFQLNIYSTSSTPYTFDTLYTFLGTKKLPAYGVVVDMTVYYYVNSVQRNRTEITFDCLKLDTTTGTVTNCPRSFGAQSFTSDTVIEM